MSHFHDITAVISDLHLGVGGRLDDFHQDKLLVDFLSNLKSQFSKTLGRHRLIMAGDCYDLVQSLKDGKSTTPIYVLKRIGLAHPQVFAKIHEFSQRYELYLILGNHDYHYQLREWRRALAKLLPYVRIVGERYIVTYNSNHGPVRIIVKHGHQYDPINQINEQGGWGNTILELIINVLEDFFPELDNISTSSLTAFLEKRLREVFKRQTKKGNLASLNPVSVFKSLLRKKPEDQVWLAIKLLELYQKTVEKGKENFLKEAEQLARGSRRYPEENVITVFGHTHDPQHQVFNRKKLLYVNSGCWVDEVSYDQEQRRFLSNPRANYALFGNDLDPYDPKQTLYSLV